MAEESVLLRVLGLLYILVLLKYSIGFSLLISNKLSSSFLLINSLLFVVVAAASSATR